MHSRLGHLLAAALIAGAVALPAFGHGDDSSENAVIVTVDPPPPALRDLKIELHKTLAPQLVIENRTGKVLELIGSDGKPFLRISAAGVAANQMSADWYRSYAVPGIPLPKAVAAEKNAAPKWAQVSKTLSWGWFDLRLRTEGITVPHKIADSGVDASVGRWKIPVTFDGKHQYLSGTFRFSPPLNGRFEARLTSPAAIAPGVHLQLLQGLVPGFFIENTSDKPITIMGSDGQPFLIVAADGVKANVKSVSWLESAQAESTYDKNAVRPGTTPEWQTRSSTPRFSWIEPRAGYTISAPAKALLKKRQRTEVRAWEIAYQYDDEQRKITGVTEWVLSESATPVKTATAHQR